MTNFIKNLRDKFLNRILNNTPKSPIHRFNIYRGIDFFESELTKLTDGNKLSSEVKFIKQFGIYITEKDSKFIPNVGHILFRTHEELRPFKHIFESILIEYKQFIYPYPDGMNVVSFLHKTTQYNILIRPK